MIAVVVEPLRKCDEAADAEEASSKARSGTDNRTRVTSIPASLDDDDDARNYQIFGLPSDAINRRVPVISQGYLRIPLD